MAIYPPTEAEASNFGRVVFESSLEPQGVFQPGWCMKLPLAEGIRLNRDMKKNSCPYDLKSHPGSRNPIKETYNCNALIWDFTQAVSPYGQGSYGFSQRGNPFSGTYPTSQKGGVTGGRGS